MGTIVPGGIISLWGEHCVCTIYYLTRLMYGNKCDTVTVGPLPWSEPMKAAISPHSVIELKPSLAMCHIVCRHRPPPPNTTVNNISNIYSLILILSGEILLNPGHGHNSTAYLCGNCERQVGWNTQAVSCDGCDLWYHQTCLSMATIYFRDLKKDHVIWLCCKCD